jgi:hypothetical protein
MPTIHWEDSLASDHALVQVAFLAPCHIKHPKEDHTNSFHMDIDDAAWGQWLTLLKECIPVVQGMLLHMQESMQWWISYMMHLMEHATPS